MPDTPLSSSLYTKEGMLGSFRAGPTIGVGAPDGARLGAFVKWKGVLAAGLALSYLPDTRIPGLDATVRRASGEAFVRVHPFQRAFFLGVSGGYARTNGTLSEKLNIAGQAQQIDSRAYATALYVAPQLGCQWMLPLGLTIGFDIGVEIPVSTSGPIISASRNGTTVAVDPNGAVAQATRKVTTMPIPVIHLLELGFAL